MNATLLSIVIPVYKAEKYIGDCIQSILDQSFADFEILLVDDGSPDRSGEICDEYATLDSRIKVFHCKNGGVTAARGKGVEHSRGEYVFFVDADDDLPREGLAEGYKYAKDNSIDILITACNRYENEQKSFKITSAVDGTLYKELYVESMIRSNCRTGPYGRFVKRELFNKVDAFSTPRTISNNEDLMMNLILASVAESVYLSNDIITYNYHLRSDSVTKSQASKFDCNYWLVAIDYCNTLLCRYKYNEYKSIRDAFSIFKLNRLYRYELPENCTVDKMQLINDVNSCSWLTWEDKKRLLIFKHHKISAFVKLYFLCIEKITKLMFQTTLLS